MTGQTAFVQPIALLRAGTHEDAIRAVALASVTAYINTIDDPAWKPWLKSHFAKSVRRSKKIGPFTAVESLAAAKAVVGEAQALAFLPTTYDDMDPTVRKFQVEGTELHRSGWSDPLPIGPLCPLVLINESPILNMSTGKAAAQAAHGLFRWFLTLNADDRAAWITHGQPFSVSGTADPDFSTQARTATTTIEDAGFTEIPPGTRTIAVLSGAKSQVSGRFGRLAKATRTIFGHA